VVLFLCRGFIDKDGDEDEDEESMQFTLSTLTKHTNHYVSLKST
jgi:hypothetical protein